MLRKWIGILLTLTLLLGTTAALADRNATSGSAGETVVFYVEAYGQASVSFSQTEGTCQELSYTHLIDGLTGEEEEWGKYHFYVTSPTGSTTVTDWDKTFNGGSFSLSFSRSGVYKVRVVPYTAQEMTDSWTLDRFVSWTRYPQWRISGKNNCAVSASKPGQTTDTGRTCEGMVSGGRNGNGEYDMGVPSLGGRSYGDGDMNMVIYWVQVQMKATGRWYQGDNWDCTGRLGDHTVSEIRSFMRSRGYGSHSGRVDQNVIDELVRALGGSPVPVYVGGIYNAMSSIMWGGSAGSMDLIVSNLRDNIPHVTVGARWVQTCLKRLGYYNSSIDGMYGEGTERAVKAFQRDYGWEQRDYVTLGVARAMLEAYYARGGSLNSLP